MRSRKGAIELKFTDPNTRPKVLLPCFENVPQELREKAQWVLWGFVWNKHSKQWAKVPYDAQTLGNAKTNDSSTLSTFDKVQAVYVEGKDHFDGIGFVFTVNDEFCGVDFDECLDAKGNISDPFAKEWVERLDCYTEKSPSLTGLHIITKSVLGPGVKRGNVEIYDRGRYFTFTGAVGKRREIHRRQSEIEELRKLLTPEQKPRAEPVALDLSAQELLEKAFASKNGAKIRRYYDGHLNGHRSQSEADLALCSLLAFWSGGNTSLIDQWFRSSGLFREKWDQKHSGDGGTYGEVTIDKALSGCTEFYRSGNQTPTAATKSPNDHKSQILTHFQFTKLVDLIAEPKEEIAYVWASTLPCGGFSILCSKPKVGKSTLARVLAIAVSQGKPFFGRATKQGKVIYLCLEEKRAEVAEHFRRMGASSSDILIFTGKTPNDMLSALEAAIEEHQPVLVIIDPLSRFVRVTDFNSYAETTRQLEPLIDMARLSACGTHILALHHNGKGGDLREAGDAVMGSTGIFGAVDALLTMRKAKEKTRTIESTQRYGLDLAETIVHLDPETGIVSPAGDMQEFLLNERKRAVLEVMCEEPIAESAIKELVAGSNGGLTSKAVRALFDDGLIVRSGAGRKGDPYMYAKAIETHNVVEEFEIDLDQRERAYA